MTKRTVAILLVFTWLAHSALAFDQSKGGDVAFYTKLRMEFAHQPDYEPGWQSLDERKAVVEAYRSGDLAKTMKLGTTWLKKVPVDSEVYLMLAMVSKEQGNFKAYCEYIAPFYGLLQSITSEGDGRTPETAFKVIAVDEEYALLREVGAKVKSQSLIGHCDKMEVERKNGATYTIYFDVRISFEAMNRLFKTK